MGKKRTRRIAALLLSLLLTLPAPSALAAESALESASSASSQAPEGESSGEESAAQPPEESSAPESSQPAGEESQPGEGESSQEEPSSQEPSSSQEESSSQAPEESSGEESGISMEDSQQETFAAYPLLVVGGHESYMSGEEGARFYPDRAMTRAEMAQVLYNLLASYPPVTGGSFSDVSDSAWYATAVNTLVELDVLSGYGDNTFRPNNAVTRAEFVTAVCKCFDSLSTGSAGFSDVSGHWAEGFINQAVAEDWISGFPDGTFRPDESIQRCQVTAILNNALERTGSGFAADAVTPEFVDVPSSHWAYEHIAEAADPVGSAIETGCTVRVTATNGLNLRSSASISSSVVTVLSTGALLTVTSVESNGWLGVRTGSGRTGYVSGEFVEYVSGPTDTPDPEPEPDPDPDGFEVGQTVRVTAEPSLRLRSGPGTNYEAITSLATGVRLTITSIESNGWLGVETASGVEGYVHPDYVEVYTGGGGGGGIATGATVSTNSLTLAQYQSARLDGSVTSNLSAMEWTSSNPSVAYVGYTVPYGGNTEGAIVYGASPGTATLTFTDGAGATATCTVTVTAAESVRFAYSDENIIGVGDDFNLTAITDSSKTGVRFTIVGGPATGSWDTTSYTSESRVSSYGLPTNQVRVFTRSVSFGRAGTYTVRAYSQTSGGSWSTDYCEFTVMVTSSDIHSSTTTTESRRVSTEGLNIIADFEGSVPEIEDDVLASGNPTVGYGYVVPVNTTFYNNLTTSELFAQLVQIANETYSPAVENFRSTYNIKMNQAHFDALTSFVFNCGVGTLSSDYGFRRALLNAVDVSGFSGSATGTVNVDDVDLGAAPVYSSASLTSQQVTTLDIGATVTVTSVSSTRTSTKQEVWYQVTISGGQVGWMPAGYIQLSGSWTRDLAWADSTVLANNFLQWNKAGGVVAGLVWRRLAECKIFFFGNYDEAYHSNANYSYNTYGFHFPEECEQYDRRP